MKQVTLKDIARATGVSTNTVSLALRNSPLVAAETRRRIVARAQELGYVPNAAAQTLVTRRSGLLGFAMGDRHQFGDEILMGLVDRARAFGYDVVVSTYRGEAPHQVVQSFQRRMAEGAILLASAADAAGLGRALTASALPSVLLLGDRPHGSLPLSTVAVDNYMGAYRAVSHLMENGHRRIGFLAGLESRPTDKARAVADALRDFGLPLRREWIIHGEHSVAGGRAAAVALLDLAPEERPTAVFARTDHIALGFVQALQERGVRVPDEISVIGYDGIEAGRLLTPPLTSMAYPAREIGARAVEILRDLIAGETQVSSLLVAPSLQGGGTVRTLAPKALAGIVTS